MAKKCDNTPTLTLRALCVAEQAPVFTKEIGDYQRQGKLKDILMAHLVTITMLPDQTERVKCTQHILDFAEECGLPIDWQVNTFCPNDLLSRLQNIKTEIDQYTHCIKLGIGSKLSSM